MHRQPRSRGFVQSHGWMLLGVWLTSAIYLAGFVHRGWIPGDEGVLGHTAERVLAGELPHRDFDDTYTGGLAFLHALAFRLLGVRLTSIRWLLYAATLISIPAFYRIAARRASPPLAGGVTLMCVAWSVPNYFAGMPSWYNLYLAAGGTLALIKHLENARRRWLFVAGLAGGFSFLIKSAGLLYIAAVLLFFVYRERQLDEEEATESGGRSFSWLVTAGLLAFATVLISFIGQRPGGMEILLYVVPSTSLCALLLGREWSRPGGRFGARLRRLLAMTVPFLAGVVVPLGLFLIPYVAQSALGSLFDGSVLFPAERLEYGVHALPILATAVCVLPLLALLALPLVRQRWETLDRQLYLLAALAAALALAFGSNLYVYQTIWFSLRPLVPVLTVVGAVVLAVGRFRDRLSPERQQVLFLLLTMAAMVSIVQFPYAWGVYFCYAAPLIILAYLFLVDAQPGPPRRLHLCTAGFYLLFALVWLNLGWVETHGRQFTHESHDTLLALDRGGLWVTAEKAQLYRRLAAEIRHRTPEGSYIYAMPECSEVYFLSARRNPTPTLADFFEEDYGTPERTVRLLKMLEERQVDVVVLSWITVFSRLPRDFAAAVLERYPHRMPFHPFTLHWRDRPAADAGSKAGNRPSDDGESKTGSPGETPE